MRREGHRYPAFAFTAMMAAMTAMAVIGAQSPAFACSVCFGDPASPMAQGAVMGVLVLIAIVAGVLVGITGTGLFWMHRGRRLARMANADPMPSAR